MPAHEKFVSGIFGAIKCLYRGKKTKGGGEGRRMVDWNRENQMRGGGGQDRWCLKLYTKATNRHQPGEGGKKSSHFFFPRLYGKNDTECCGGY
jgi:hypothetical protein